MSKRRAGTISALPAAAPSLVLSIASTNKLSPDQNNSQFTMNLENLFDAEISYIILKNFNTSTPIDVKYSATVSDFLEIKKQNLTFQSDQRYAYLLVTTLQIDHFFSNGTQNSPYATSSLWWCFDMDQEEVSLVIISATGTVQWSNFVNNVNVFTTIYWNPGNDQYNILSKWQSIFNLACINGGFWASYVGQNNRVVWNGTPTFQYQNAVDATYNPYINDIGFITPKTNQVLLWRNETFPAYSNIAWTQDVVTARYVPVYTPLPQTMGEPIFGTWSEIDSEITKLSLDVLGILPTQTLITVCEPTFPNSGYFRQTMFPNIPLQTYLTYGGNQVTSTFNNQYITLPLIAPDYYESMRVLKVFMSNQVEGVVGSNLEVISPIVPYPLSPMIYVVGQDPSGGTTITLGNIFAPIVDTPYLDPAEMVKVQPIRNTTQIQVSLRNFFNNKKVYISQSNNMFLLLSAFTF